MEGFGWMDRSYESIPKAHRMTRATWLTAFWAAEDKKAKRDTPADVLAGRALAQVDQEDFAAAQPFALKACGN